SPSPVYSNPGVYDAVLTADDGRGGIARDTVVVTVIDPSAGFPSTPVIDTFDRPDGPLGAPWVGQPERFEVSGNALVETAADGWAVWSGAPFGPAQEAWFTLDVVSASAPEHDLMLAVQGLSWQDGEIEVLYDATVQGIQISTYTPGPEWQERGTPIPL